MVIEVVTMEEVYFGLKRPATLPLCKSGIGDNGIGVFRSQETRHLSFLNNVASVDGNGRGRYRYHTSNYPSHNLGGHGRLLGHSLASRPVHKSVRVK